MTIRAYTPCDDLGEGRPEVTEQQINLGVVWEQVVRELSAATLSPQQRAWMRVTRPIGLLDGTALLAAPSDFAKEAIEREAARFDPAFRRWIEAALRISLEDHLAARRRRFRYSAELEELLAPVQADFARSGMTQDELIDLGRGLVEKVRADRKG